MSSEMSINAMPGWETYEDVYPIRARSTSRGGSRSNSRPAALKIEDINTASSDRYEELELREYEEAQSMVGVSIGREQTRLISPTTPAVEKSAAFDKWNSWGFFDDSAQDEQEEELRNALQNTLGEDSSPEVPGEENWGATSSIQLPTPWTSGPKMFIQSEDGKVSKKGGGSRNRSRAGSATALGDNFKRMFSSITFPALPDSKDLTRLLPGGGRQDALNTSSTRVGRSSSFANKLSWGSGGNRSRSNSRANVSPPIDRALDDSRLSPGHRRMQSTPQNLTLQIHRYNTSNVSTNELRMGEDGAFDRIRTLKRSVSEESKLNRTASIVSSLGDDSRFEHIDSQINSRFKAIRDSLQDSLPSMPSINFSALRPEFTTKRGDQSEPLKAMGTVYGKGESQPHGVMESNTPPSPRKSQNSKHPTLDFVLGTLEGDIVVMGGYRGSTLRSAEPPNRQLWVPIKVGLGVRKVELAVGLNPEDEEEMEQRIIPSGMLTHIGPVDISRRLFKKLRACKNAREGKLRVHDYGYDWRLSPALLSRKLANFLAALPCNSADTPASKRGAIVIAHSLGGLITRHVCNGRPELFAGILFAGTPQHCVNILGPLRNGDEVLLSSKVLTAQVNFTLRTSFILLPESGQCFIDKDTKEQYHVNFFDVQSWKHYAFSPCISPALPAIVPLDKRNRLTNLVSSTITITKPLSDTASTRDNPGSAPSADSTIDAVTKAEDLLHPQKHTLNVSMSSPPPPVAVSTIPLPLALAYLERTLVDTLTFKRALAHNSTHQSNNLYPPLSLIYSTSIPTVYGARVAGREGIKRADAYDNLAFASGDGVVLARAAMVPRGYKVADGGRVRTERGHVSLLGDLEAVGKCLLALCRAREDGVGVGAGMAKTMVVDETEAESGVREREVERKFGVTKGDKGSFF